MHVLCVIDHPEPGSFSHQIAARFAEGLAQAGHSHEVADLHAEGFDPRWTAADAAVFRGAAVPGDVAAEQERIERADALTLIFPLFWYGMPAMTKGWFDRVWSFGWAYDQVDDPGASLQRPRRALMLIPAGGRPEDWHPKGVDKDIARVWRDGMLGLFGMANADIRLLTGAAVEPEARRDAILTEAFEAGRGF